MAEGRREEQWGHTSFLLAMIHNVNCAKKGDQKTPRQLNPLHAQGDEVVEKVKLKDVKGLLMAMKPRPEIRARCSN